MDKFEKNLINWLAIGFFLIIDIALIPLMFMYFWPEQAPYIGDIFGWAGAIIGGLIGGLLTFLGVKITLKKQALDSYTEKYKELLEAKSYLELTLKMIPHYRLADESEEAAKANLVSMLDEVSQNRDVVYKKASKGSLEIYDNYIEFMLVIAEWKTRIEINDYTGMDELFKQYYIKLKGRYDDINQEFSKFKSEYKKLKSGLD